MLISHHVESDSTWCDDCQVERSTSKLLALCLEVWQDWHTYCYPSCQKVGSSLLLLCLFFLPNYDHWKNVFCWNLKWQEHWSWTPTTSRANWSVCEGYDKTSGDIIVYTSAKVDIFQPPAKSESSKHSIPIRLIWAVNNASVFGVLSWVLTLDKNEPIGRCSWIYLSMW
jgi:hypothetical protein